MLMTWDRLADLNGGDSTLSAGDFPSIFFRQGVQGPPTVLSFSFFASLIHLS